MTEERYRRFIVPAAVKALEDMADGEVFTATDFKRRVAQLCPKARQALTSSCIRPIWDYRMEDGKKCSFICLDQYRGIYRKVSLAEWEEKYEEEFLCGQESHRIRSAIRLLKRHGYKVSAGRGE